MERPVERQLERIKTLRAGGQPEEARALIDEQREKGVSGLQIDALDIGVSLDQGNWKEAISRIRVALKEHALSDLLGGDNLEPLTEQASQNPGFRMALTGCALDAPTFQPVRDWAGLGDRDRAMWLVGVWLQSANEVKEPKRSASLLAAAGVGYFVIDDWDNAWEQWATALRKNPDLFKKIMGFVKSDAHIDKTRLDHRFRMIQLIAASGRINETLTLLQALGAESRENAAQAAAIMPRLLDDQMNRRNAAELRFNLAIQAGDPGLLKQVAADFRNLNEDDLFYFKRSILQRVKDLKVRRLMLMELVRTYMDSMSWENAALLLEKLYAEQPAPEIIAMMEQVLDNYPILSQLHFLIGKFYLECGNKLKALRSLGVIREVKEYRKLIRGILENHLMRDEDPDIAEMLLNLLPPKSHHAGATACLLVFLRGSDSEGLLKKWLLTRYKGSEKPSPFGILAMIHLHRARQDREKCYDALCRYISYYPRLGTEAVAAAEWLCETYNAPFVEIIKRMETCGDALEPRDVWRDLRERFAKATEEYSQSSGGGRIFKTDQVDLIDDSGQDASLSEKLPEPGDLESALVDLRKLLDAGISRETMVLARQALEQFPGNTNKILNPIESKAKRAIHETVWTLGLLELLVGQKEYGKAIKLGQMALSQPHFQPDLHQIYQNLALAFEGIGHKAEALRFFCLASRQARWYERNKTRLVEMTLPDHHHLLKEVLNLVRMNEDQDSWHLLMNAWRQHEPDKVNELVEQQHAFTNQVETPRSILDLAFWQLQASDLTKVHDTLGRIDLRDPDIRESLVHIANLINLKHPNDPKPKFLLGKYFLLHQDVSKAVDTFRNLAKQAPGTAEPIYLYLRSYLKSNPETLDTIYIYGLMIRFALAHGPATIAIKLLDEYSRKDKEGAESLTDGVYRVIVQKEDKLEALYAFEELLRRWGARQKFLHVETEGALGDHMAHDRLKWIEEIKRDPELRDWACLCGARLLFRTQEFKKCRETLADINDEKYRREALTLYERLSERFPKDMELWLEAGFAAFPQEGEKARAFFRKVHQFGKASERVAAYAGLMELGEAPELDSIAEEMGEDALYPGLKSAYRKFREAELDHWRQNGGDAPMAALSWLYESGGAEPDFDARVKKLEPPQRARLEAKALGAQGALTQAAWRFSAADGSTAQFQSYLFNAGLAERAVLARDGGAPLPKYLRAAFLDRYGKPAVIQARFAHLQTLASRNKGREKKSESPDIVEKQPSNEARTG